MQDISLEKLLEAGCHFGHKAERWNPKATDYIYTEKDGIHIIDLAKTKAGLVKAIQFIEDLVKEGQEVIFIGTKRQAKDIIEKEASAVGAPYFAVRWIGGFLTNWEEIKKNIDKINRLTREKEEGVWKKYPKHEQTKLSRYLDRLNIYYKGVLHLTRPPQAIVIVDVRKESSALREAKRIGIPVIGIVDTNSDPRLVDYVIPANDDALGSISLLIHSLAMAYDAGKKIKSEEKPVDPPVKAVVKEVKSETKKDSEKKQPEKKPAKLKKGK